MNSCVYTGEMVYSDCFGAVKAAVRQRQVCRMRQI